MTHNVDVYPEFLSIESRNSKLVIENKQLRDEITKLKHEKKLLYTSLLKMKVDIDNHFDALGKVYFTDEFYEDK